MIRNVDFKTYVIPNLPYAIFFWFFCKVAEGYRLSGGADMATRVVAALSGLTGAIAENPLPGFHPRDLLVGLAGAAVRAAVYLKGKNAKKYRSGVERREEEI